MNMKKIVAFSLAALAMTAYSEVEEQLLEPAAKAVKQDGEADPFTPLPLCRVVQGTVEVKKPSSTEWQAAEEGKFYPLGSAYRTSGQGHLVVAFGPDCIATISGDASFSTRNQKIGEKARTVVLGNGVLKLELIDNLKDGLFFVTSPGFVVKNLAGSSLFTYTNKGDGDEATVKCVTGSLSLEGRHFKIAQMHAADEVQIRSSHDLLNTFLYGKSGDYVVELDQGVKEISEFNDEGVMVKKVEKSSLKWNLSPETKIRIGRMVPSIGERMSVVVMTFDVSGEMKNHYAFAEGRAEVNTGELVAASKEEQEALAKRAAEAAQSTAGGDGASQSDGEAAQESSSDSAEE
jgi:hypothetical protein